MTEKTKVILLTGLIINKKMSFFYFPSLQWCHRDHDTNRSNLCTNQQLATIRLLASHRSICGQCF